MKEGEAKPVPAKRVNIVSVKLVKERSRLYKKRSIRSPEDGYQLLNQVSRRSRSCALYRCLFRYEEPANSHQHLSHWKFECKSCSFERGHETSYSVKCRFYFSRTYHPSGLAEPSQEDINVTKKLAEAGK